jgi:deoxyadenosine/deoxycytidine kinase
MSMRKSICNPPALKAELESLLNAENEEYNQEEEPEYIEDLLNKYDDLIDEFTAVTISESQFRSSKVDDIKTLINFISERIRLENEVVNLYHIIVSNIMEDKKPKKKN